MTRFYSNVFKNRFREIDSKTQYLQQNILSMLCLSLMGFLSGNLFGTFLPSLRKSIVWDGFIIACLLVVSEMISCFCYNPIRYQLKISRYRVSIDRHYKPEVLLKQKLAFLNPLFAQGGKGQVRSCKQDQTRALGGKAFRKLRFVARQNSWRQSRLPVRAMSTGLERNRSFPSTPMQCLSIDRLFKRSVRTDFRFVKRPSMYSKKTWNVSKNLNIFKIGVMIGFFVDAFKVGS